VGAGFRPNDQLPLSIELFITHFMVDERHSFAVCRATTAFWVEDIMPPLPNSLTAPTANGMVILALLVHHKDLHRRNRPSFHAKASLLELVAYENHVEVQSILWRSFRGNMKPHLTD
jgi:hypothetical protein